MNLEILKGYKTYLVAAGIGLVAFARAMGYLDDETAAIITSLLIGGGIATLRAAVSSETKEQTKVIEHKINNQV